MAVMVALEPFSATALDSERPRTFAVRRSQVQASPFVYASPHSGRTYPPDMMAALQGVALRRSEDAYVDQLVDAAPALGAALITAGLARAYIDVNRQAFELDPAMFADKLPDFAQGRTARVAAGLGAIARLVSEGQEIYARKLTFAEAQQRIAAGHAPYHAELTALIDEAEATHGFAILLDWHSMPAAATRANSRDEGCDLVLGDRFGAACSGSITDAVEAGFRAMGYKVARNTPYAGGYTTEHYGRPHRRRHALQIEINRGLYIDETSLALTEGFSRLKTDIEQLTSDLVGTDWSALREVPA